jgi:hypothetical protein
MKLNILYDVNYVAVIFQVIYCYVIQLDRAWG